MAATESFSLLLSLFLLYSATAQPATVQGSDLYYGGLASPPTDLQVSPVDASIVVSAGNMLHRLNPDFSHNSSVTTVDRQAVYRIALSHNTSDVLLACKDVHCTRYDVDWIFQSLFTHNRVADGFDGIPLSTDPSGFYIASSDTLEMSIEQIDQDGLFTRDFVGIFDSNNFYQRQFLYGFVHGDYVYFIARDNGTLTSNTNNVRILRLCHDFEVIAFEAAYEAVLECSAMTVNSRVEISHSLLNEYGNIVITFAVITDIETNICSFFLDEINAEMDSAYDDCSSDNYSSVQIPLVWYDQPNCFIFASPQSNKCDFELDNHISTVPALATFNSVAGQHLLRFNNSEEVTAILTASVGFTKTTDLLFVALSTHDQHFLEKYHITSDGEAQFVYREQYNQSVTLLRWNGEMQEMYGGNSNSVFGLPLERCSNYTSCSECTNSGDPLCGWCALGQYCSPSVECPKSSRKGHWVNTSEECITSVSLAQDSMAVDLIQSVDLVVVPEEAVLPTRPPHHYQCTFYHESVKNTSYRFTAPFSNGKCQLQPAQISTFDGPYIDLDFSFVLQGNEDNSLFPTTSSLVLHNCSHHTDCASCVEASESCGWCVHDRTCTGNSSQCRDVEDWRSLTASYEHGVCPVLLTPGHGSYTLPVSVSKEIVISTLNIPPEIPDYRYGCRIVYRNGRTVVLGAVYINHTDIRCLALKDQVHMSSDVTNGSESTQLEILWLKNSTNFSVALYSIELTLYDCTKLGSDCSNCWSANLGTGFECLWCDRDFMPATCSVIDNCKIAATAIDDIANCPAPIITDFSPVSGPTSGGTRLTITGANLGAMADDIMVELLKMEGQSVAMREQCAVDHSSYIPGSRVVCITSEADFEGDHTVSITIQRGTTTATTASVPSHIFTYAHPIISSVEPKQGPKAGRTHIEFKGSNLDISSPGTAKAFIGDVPCDIKSVTATVISCVARPVQAASPQLHTRIVIDNANLVTQQYQYTENPIFEKVEPQNIILSGGVTLTFKGNYLNVVVNPELIMSVNNYTLISACSPQSASTLKCIAPKLPVIFSPNPRRNLAEIYTGVINYTITMDGAAGPSSSTGSLQIVVKPDPVFHSIHISDREYMLESGRTIRILGSDINSVLPAELSVMIDDTICSLAKDDITDTQIRCFPPDTVLPGDRLVRVFVGQYGLNYTVGFLRYTKASSDGSNNDLLLIIIPALTGVIILMLTILAMFCCSIGILIRKKRTYKANQRSIGLYEEDKTDFAMVPVFPNMYNGNRHVSGHHEYDTIPDALEQMQRQQMEMITCVPQQGRPLTDISTTKHSGNIYYSEDEGHGSSASSSNNHRSGSSRPTSCTFSGDSRPHSSSTTGSVSLKNVKRPPLPPLPTSMSDEYVAMHSYTESDSSPTDKTQTPTTATVIVHEPHPPQKVMASNDYDKLEPKKGTEEEKETTKTAETELVALSQQTQMEADTIA